MPSRQTNPKRVIPDVLAKMRNDVNGVQRQQANVVVGGPGNGDPANGYANFVTGSAVASVAGFGVGGAAAWDENDAVWVLLPQEASANETSGPFGYIAALYISGGHTVHEGTPFPTDFDVTFPPNPSGRYMQMVLNIPFLDFSSLGCYCVVTLTGPGIDIETVIWPFASNTTDMGFESNHITIVRTAIAPDVGVSTYTLTFTVTGGGTDSVVIPDTAADEPGIMVIGI